MRHSLTLDDLYRDISPDLDGVEQEIREVLGSERTEIAEMTRHATGNGGKRMRPAMILLVGRAAGGAVRPHQSLGSVVEMIHLATLVHDDVIDQADIRRRRATVRALWGSHDAVLLGDIIFARAIHHLARMGDERALLVLTTAVSTLCEGEILQNHHCRNADLSPELYYEIIEAKTAELYASGCELAAHLAGASEPLIRGFRSFGRELGLAFQITDDCLDLVGDETIVGKSLGTDLQGGKMTLPLLLLRDRADAEARAQLVRVISEERPEEDGVGRVVELVRSSGALDDALARAREHVAAGLAAVRGLVSETAYGPLEAIGAFVLSRSL